MISCLITHYQFCSFAFAPSVAKLVVWAVQSILAPTHAPFRLLRGKTILGELILLRVPFILMSGLHGGCRIYRAVMNHNMKEQYTASSQHHFCMSCSAMLWLYAESWYVWYWLLCSGDGDLCLGQTFYIHSHLRLILLNSKILARWSDS